MEELENQIRIGGACLRLVENEDFQTVMKYYIDDWAITQTRNVSVYEPDSRRVVMEQMLARSTFFNFIDETADMGREAIEAKREMSEDD